MTITPGTRLTWIYLLTQGLAGLVWWVWLFAVPSARWAFTPDGLPESFIMSYALPDTLLFILGSLLTAVAFICRMPAASTLLWVLVGAVSYATLHCFGLQLQHGGYWSPTIMMLCACLCTLVFACTSKPSDSTLPVMSFKASKPSRPMLVFGRTLIQIIVFWGVFLLLLPMLIVFIERGIGVQGFSVHPRWGWLLFALASALGLWSAWSMAWFGKGTPLPTDHATELVVRGPYSFIRNPMVIAGILQGLGVMMLLGSWLMVPYGLMGCVFWQYCIRPIEELDLHQRFGKAYEEYRDRVPCWYPRLGSSTD